MGPITSNSSSLAQLIASNAVSAFKNHMNDSNSIKPITSGSSGVVPSIVNVNQIAYIE